MNRTGLCPRSGRLYEWLYRHLGPWIPRHIQRDMPSRSRLILELRTVAQDLGRAPTTSDWPKLRETERVHPLYIYYVIFGSFLAAVKQAKLKPRYLQEFDEVEKARMIEELRALSRRLKQRILGKDVVAARKERTVSPINHFQLAFGSVPAAIAVAGVAPKATYSRQELIEALRNTRFLGLNGFF